MTKIETWKFYGRYHDDDSPEWVYINTQPDDLPKYIKKELFKYDYEKMRTETSDGCAHDAFIYNKVFHRLQDEGLVREVGNAWNTNIRWAPGMSEWIDKNKENK